MGGKEKTKKTFEQVRQDLYRQLYTSANKLLANVCLSSWFQCTVLNPLQKPGALPDDIVFEDLSRVVERVSHERFNFQYGYEYKGQRSTPPSDDPQRKITSSEGISSYDCLNDGGIAQYIEQRILKYDHMLA